MLTVGVVGTPSSSWDFMDTSSLDLSLVSSRAASEGLTVGVVGTPSKILGFHGHFIA